MLVVRPVREDDLDAVVELVDGVGIGMTSLPRDHDSLARKVSLSGRSFAAGPGEWSNGGGEEFFFFVLEDTETGAVVGTTGVKAGVGLDEPFYSYRVGTVVHASRELGVHRVVPTLYLTNDYTGCAEVGSLFLHADYRRGGMGRLLSKCRFLFLAEHMDRFPEKVIAEMRGVSDAQGTSPFWDALGRQFFDMPFYRADYLSGTRGKTFIAELMPHNPIYVPLLAPEAQAVIGEVHEDTRAALRLLQAEGFHYEGYVDIFDAGPTLEARVAEISAVRASRCFRAVAGEPGPEAPLCVVAAPGWRDFRSALAHVEHRGGDAVVAPSVLHALAVNDGDTIRAVPSDVADRGERWHIGETGMFQSS